jgi:hypothetical protein
MIGTQQFDAADFRFFGEATIVVGDRAPSVRAWRRLGVGRSNQAWLTFNVQVWSLGNRGIFRQPQMDPTRVFVAAHPGEETVVTLEGEILPVDEGFMQSARRTASYYNSEDADNKSELRTLLEKNGYRTSWPVQASRTIRVVDDPNSGVVLHESDAMKTALNEVIGASFREMTMSGRLAHVSLSVAPVWNAQAKERLEALREFNLAVAHRVYLRLPSGEEVRTEGFIVDDQGAPWGVVPIDPATMGGYFQDDDSFPVVVLRPDPSVARSAVGIKDVWNGVLEIPITVIERKNMDDEMRRIAEEAQAEVEETEKIKALTPAPIVRNETPDCAHEPRTAPPRTAPPPAWPPLLEAPGAG